MNLSDTSLLLTRPEPASERFRQAVEAALGRFGQVVVSPVLRIVPLVSPEQVPEAECFVFTSENGVAAVAPVARGQRAWCVGARTAQAAEAAGFEPIAAGGDAASLAETILSAGAEGRLLHVSGRHRRGDLVGRLRAGGLQAELLEAYDQVAVPLSEAAVALLQAPGPVIAPVFSPRSAALLAEAAEGRRATVHLAAISRAAAEPWQAGSGEHVSVAPRPDAAGVLAAMGSLFDADRSA